MKIKIGHLSYEVRRPSGPVEEGHNENVHGRCYVSKGVILMVPGGTPQEEAATLIHEAIHAMWWAYRLPKKLDEEDTCCRLEGPLAAFLADNPHAVAAIIAASQGVPLPIN